MRKYAISCEIILQKGHCWGFTPNQPEEPDQSPALVSPERSKGKTSLPNIHRSGCGHRYLGSSGWISITHDPE